MPICGAMADADSSPIERRLRARPLAPGHGRGSAFVLGGPLSFWGGVDPASGRIIDGRHPQFGDPLSDRVVLLPGGRGSSSSSSVLAEMIRAGTAPAAIVMLDPDPVLALGAVVAAELYGRSMPVVQLDGDAYRSIDSVDGVFVDASESDALVRVRPGLSR
jgi:predicted aconitase with swiveling domain